MGTLLWDLMMIFWLLLNTEALFGKGCLSVWVFACQDNLPSGHIGVGSSVSEVPRNPLLFC